MNHAAVEDLRHETERELDRVVDRLTHMPLTKAEEGRAAVRECADALFAESRRLGVPLPADARLPDLAPQGFGALIAVLGQDCLQSATTDDDLAATHAALVRLRRSLP